MFAALGRLTSRRPWYVIAAWLVIAVVVIATHPTVKATTDQSDFLPHHYESIQATDIMQKAFSSSQQQQTYGATIVFDHSDGSPLAASDLQQIDQLMAGVHLPSDFTTTTPAAASPNNKIAYVNIGMTKAAQNETTAELDQVVPLRDQLAKATQGTGLQALATGELPQDYDQSQSGNKALAIVTGATFLLIVVLLGVIFRSVLIAIMPLVLVGLVSGIANGLIDWAEKIFSLQASDSTSVILIVVLFGIGTDYILFFLFRYRERMRHIELATDKATRRAQHRESVAYAVEHAGEAIASAGGAVFVSFMTLVLSSLGIFKSIGPSLAIAVAVTLLAAITLVPAVVTVLGSRALFWPGKKWHNEPKGARFAWIGRQLGNRPGRTAITAGGVLVILALFCVVWGGFKPTFDLTSSGSSQTTDSAVATKKLDDNGLAGATQSTTVVLTSTNGRPLTAGELTAFGEKLQAAPGVASEVRELKPSLQPAEVSADKKTAIYAFPLKDGPDTDAGIADVKDGVRPAAHAAAPPGTEAYVGGLTSVFVDFKAAMDRDYAVVFPVAALIILIILGLVLRSLVAPWYLMISVGLGFAATLGATVLVFQHAAGQNGLIFLMPIYIYLFVVALGTDYNILMISRLREEARAGKTPREAAAIAVQHAGPTIGAAGLILAGTFASLMLGGNSLLTTMGFAISFGIAIAAFVMAMFLTPALTALIGHTAWWPGHGDEEKPHRELVG